ncbi:StAR-related lipid transfer protein 9, partial [Varanus komodoensis]
MANVKVAVRVRPLSKRWDAASKSFSETEFVPWAERGPSDYKIREQAEGGRIIIEVEDRVAKVRNIKCKEIENNRIGRTRDLFKRIGDMKGVFHAKMGTIKDQNGRDLTEAEEIKKRWQDYPEELDKKVLNVPDNHDGVVTDLEPDILECEVKWALGCLSNNKASGGDSIPAELFKILKDDAVDNRYEGPWEPREKVVAFGFDYCYWSVDPEDSKYSSQEVVFQDLGTSVLSGAFKGYNICLFAYGQTGSGKTYTMMGTP